MFFWRSNIMAAPSGSGSKLQALAGES
jgi:hypothetical protein